MLRTSNRCCLTSDIPCLTGIRPQAEVSCMNFFLLFEALLLLRERQTFGLQLPHASCVSIQRTECADTTKQDAVRRRFKDLDRKSDGRSIYIYIYMYTINPEPECSPADKNAEGVVKPEPQARVLPSPRHFYPPVNTRCEGFIMLIIYSFISKKKKKRTLPLSRSGDFSASEKC